MGTPRRNTLNSKHELKVTMQRIAISLTIVLAALCHAGCAKKTDVKDYVPPEDAARTSLATALDAWKAGKAPDQIGATNPAIHAQDVQWRDGKKLTAYEIVGPAPSEDQNRRFTVKITLEGAGPVETTYVILGIDPILVFSAESYQRAAGM